MTQTKPAMAPRFLDLSLGSVARISYFSVFGLYAAVATVALAFYAVAFFMDPRHGVANLWQVPVGMVAMVIMAPFAWAGLLVGGFALQRRLRPAPEEAALAFTGEGADYPALESDSIYRFLTFCSRGVINVASALWAVALIAELAGQLLAGHGLDYLYVGAKMVMVALGLLVGPYLWGWLFMMGSLIGKPVARRLGRGALSVRG